MNIININENKLIFFYLNDIGLYRLRMADIVEEYARYICTLSEIKREYEERCKECDAQMIKQGMDVKQGWFVVIPPEILEHILSYVEATDLTQFRQTCKYFLRFTNQYRIVDMCVKNMIAKLISSDLIRDTILDNHTNEFYDVCEKKFKREHRYICADDTLQICPKFHITNIIYGVNSYNYDFPLFIKRMYYMKYDTPFIPWNTCYFYAEGCHLYTSRGCKFGAKCKFQHMYVTDKEFKSMKRPVSDITRAIKHPPIERVRFGYKKPFRYGN